MPVARKDLLMVEIIVTLDGGLNIVLEEKKPAVKAAIDDVFQKGVSRTINGFVHYYPPHRVQEIRVAVDG